MQKKCGQTHNLVCFFSFQKGHNLYKLKTKNYSDLYALVQFEK